MWLYVCLFSLVGVVAPHGRLVDPPARSCMWRYGYNTPKNYDDNALFCGGRAKQWEELNGKCGVCGDAFDDPKPSNVDGGQFATGTIAGHYGQGEVIQVQVEVTANHGGYFEFRLCPLRGLMKEATQECLDRNRLLLLGNQKDWTIPTKVSTNYTMSVQLPPEVTCRRCVLQWKWVTANSWGCDTNSDCCIGCGPQENFVNCADISIGGPAPRRPQPQPQAPKPPTERPEDPVTYAERTVVPARPQTASRSGYQAVPQYSIGVQPESPRRGYYNQPEVARPPQNTGYTSYYPPSRRPISGSGRPSAQTMYGRPAAQSRTNTYSGRNVRPSSGRPATQAVTNTYSSRNIQPAYNRPAAQTLTNTYPGRNVQTASARRPAMTSYSGYNSNGRSTGNYQQTRPANSQPRQANQQRSYPTRVNGGRTRSSSKPPSSGTSKKKSRRCRLKFQVPGFNMNCGNLCKSVRGNCVSKQKIPVIDSACTLMCRYA